MTVFIKRYPSMGEFPKGNGDVFSDMGVLEYSEVYGWDVDPEWWLEEIELPSEDEVNFKYPLNSEEPYKTSLHVGCRQGANFILNHLKSNTNGNTIE